MPTRKAPALHNTKLSPVLVRHTVVFCAQQGCPLVEFLQRLEERKQIKSPVKLYQLNIITTTVPSVQILQYFEVRIALPHRANTSNLQNEIFQVVQLNLISKKPEKQIFKQTHVYRFPLKVYIVYQNESLQQIKRNI